ncbi:MAG: FAD-dependent monooxygenase, partial [Actinomycetia bacterium]|nr:FAD-dependent monooxygenase [Actinomycetes bacterium]
AALRGRPVLIVGAGPAGLTAAIELIRRGVPVRCIDRAATPSGRSKALGIWPRTIELLRGMGGDDLLATRASPQAEMRYYSSGRVVASLRFRTSTQPLICPQPDVEEILRDGLAAVGGRIERGTELVRLEQDPDGVTAWLRRKGAAERERFAYVIGGDGASSTVRSQLGVGFEGSTHEMDFVVADVDLDGPLEHDVTHYFCSPNGILVSTGLPSGRSRVFTSAPAGMDRNRVELATVQRLVDERGPGGLILRDPEWLSVFSVHARHADRTRVGRVFLVGDAAHIHSPAGGQGLNTGVTDAHNLAWKLALVWHGHAHTALLDSYETERGQVARSVLRQADLQTRIWLLRAPWQVALRDSALRTVSALRLLHLGYLPWLAGLRTTYPTVQRSRRAMDGFVPGALVPAKPVRRPGSDLRAPLRSLLVGSGYTVLVVESAEPKAETRAVLTTMTSELSAVVAVRSLDRRTAILFDGARPAQLRRGRRSATVVLVRPDGHIDLRVAERDVAAVRVRLNELFGPLLQSQHTDSVKARS